VPLTLADIDNWSNEATRYVAETQRSSILARLARLQPGFQTPEQDVADQLTWSDLEKRALALDPDGTQHRRRLAAILGDLVCDAEGAPYVARVLVGDHTITVAGQEITRLAGLGDQLETVRARMQAGRKNPEKCPGVVGLTEDEWQLLGSIKPTVATPTDH
jgi:hypothetical protein